MHAGAEGRVKRKFDLVMNSSSDLVRILALCIHIHCCHLHSKKFAMDGPATVDMGVRRMFWIPPTVN